MADAAAAQINRCLTSAHLRTPLRAKESAPWAAMTCPRLPRCGESCPDTSKETVLSPAASDGKSKNDSPPKEERRIDEK